LGKIGWGLRLALLLAVAAAIAKVGGGFVLDDEVAIAESACVTGPLDLPQIFGTNFWCETGQFRSIQSWRPLVVLLWWGLWHIAPSPSSFIVLNVVLHVGCVLGLVAVGRGLRLRDRSIMFGALWFAPLAIHVDALATGVGASELLAALLVLLCLAAFLRGRSWFLAAGLAALLAKESGVLAVALVAAVIVVVPDERRFGSRRNQWLALLALAAGTIAILAWRASVIGAWTGTQIPAFVNPLVDASFGERVISGLALVGRYHRLTLAGGPLSADYAYAAIGVGDATPWMDVVMGVAAVGLWLMVAWLGRARASIRFLCVFVLGTSLFVSNIPFVLPAMFAERLFYLPTVAISLLVGVGLHWLMQAPNVRPTLPLVGLAGFVAAQLGLSVAHGLRYRDELTIIEHTVATTPDNARARMWLANRDIRRGDAEAAREHAEAALDIRPGWGSPLAVLAALDDMDGHPEAALAKFRRAMASEPQDGTVASLFVQFLLKYGHREHAQLVYAAHSQARGAPDPRVPVPQ
jgi:hypothetical protein